MQVVSGLTDKIGLSHEKARKLDVGEQWLLKAVRDNALLLDKISKYLDVTCRRNQEVSPFRRTQPH